MFTRSHNIIIKELGHRLSILVASLYSLIPGLQSLVSSLESRITLFQVFLSQNVAVPSQKPRCSKSVPRPFQRNSRFCSKFVPSSLSFLVKIFLKAWFARAFSKSLSCIICPSAYAPVSPLAHSLKLHQNYTRITPNLTWSVSIVRQLVNIDLARGNTSKQETDEILIHILQPLGKRLPAQRSY